MLSDAGRVGALCGNANFLVEGVQVKTLCLKWERREEGQCKVATVSRGESESFVSGVSGTRGTRKDVARDGREEEGFVFPANDEDKDVELKIWRRVDSKGDDVVVGAHRKRSSGWRHPLCLWFLAVFLVWLGKMGSEVVVLKTSDVR